MIINFRKTLLAATVLSMAGSPPAWAQESEEAASGGDIIVTARRVEERLQDVPISITVFSQETLTRNNITNAKDLATYTPGLSTNNRYGTDNTTFAIRGFTQELRALSTVGTYFADVVAPRGSGSTQGGDGAGPGSLFDLQNVQVLKGPQGTLFGRNVTGGAVLLVPRKPTDNFEGYIEGSYGDYDMRRLQGVVNVPVSDAIRLRVSGDRMKRDGWLKNIGRFGDGAHGNHGMGDVDYWAVRVSAVIDVTPELENYTIFSYSDSKSNGVIPKITGNGISVYPAGHPQAGQLSNGCYAGVVQVTLAFGDQACAQVAREAQHDFWTVSNRLPDSRADSEQWQVINTTTWQASDNLTIKNILAYGEFRGDTNLDLFGNYFLIPGVVAGQETSGAQIFGFAFTHSFGGGLTNAQSSLVEELQFQGNHADGRLTWQAGLYAELNDPIGFAGVQTASFTACADIVTFSCVPFTPGVSVGTGSFSIAKTKFRDYAIYGQASYNITDKLKLTGGLRYTWDKMSVILHNITKTFGNPTMIRCSNVTAADYVAPTPPSQTPPSPYTLDQRFDVCRQDLEKKTSAPTWVVGLDYKPIDEVLFYLKYSRGYRQGGITIFGPDPIQPYEEEKVDTYEVGVKTNWRGPVPGTFNFAYFYNDFRNQQLPFGVSCVSGLPGFTIPCSANSAIINAGTSRLLGFETELSVTPLEGLRIDAAYGFLRTKLLTIETPAPGSLPPYNVFTPPVKGRSITNTQPHKATVAVNYTLPLDESIGRITVGGTYIFTGEYRAQTDQITGSRNGVLPETNVFNINVDWENIAGMPIDAAFFMTNVTNEHIYLHSNDNQPRGFVSYFIGEPRMWGFRLRYKFGGMAD